MPRHSLLLLLLTGCAATHRGLKFFGPEQMAREHTPSEGLVAAEIQRGKVSHFAEGDAFASRDGRAYVRPSVLRDGDTLVLSSHQENVRYRLLVRGNGLFERHDFQRIHTLTGTLDRRYPNEVLLLPEDLNQPVRLSMSDLSNPYNNYGVDHADLLMIVAERGSQTEQLLFKRRASGVYLRTFAGLLATVPLTEETRGVAPILAAGPTFGWRTRNVSGPLLMFDTIELVVSVGLGSTALEAVADEVNVEGQVDGLFNATLAGGGIRIFKVVTVQGFVNTSQFFRNAAEAPTTLAVGVDASGLAAAARDIFTRLLRENPIRERNSRRSAR